MDWLAWWAWGVALGTLLLPFVMLLVVPAGRKPSSAIAWLLVIAILPWVGLFLFLLLGHRRLPRQRRRRLREMDQQLRNTMDATVHDEEAPWVSVRLTEEHAGIALLAQRLGALPPFRGNGVEVIADYDEGLGRMAADIDAAIRYVHLQTYLFSNDPATQPVIAALERAASRGVRVRVLIDHLGSRGFAGHGRLLRRLRRAGARVAYALPFQPWYGRVGRPDLRNHRKVLVVDGDIGHIGSQNLVHRSYRKAPWSVGAVDYLDVSARVRGPIVQQLDAVFRGDWYAETGEAPQDAPLPQIRAGTVLAQVLASGPGHAEQSNLRVFNALIHSANQRIVIVNAYFVPDETLMMALTNAAHRGVEVHLVTPEIGNQVILRLAQRSYYEELLTAGVHIHLHPRPWNLHTKTMTIDDEACVIGSSNLDIRSFDLNLETSLICYDSSVVAQLRPIEDAYMAASKRLDLARWRRTPASHRAVQNLARLTSALQ